MHCRQNSFYHRFVCCWRHGSKVGAQKAAVWLKEIQPILAQRTCTSLSIWWVHFQIQGYLVYFFIFILFQIEIPVSKQWRPWSDAAFCGDVAFCGVWSGSYTFYQGPKNGTLGMKWAASWQNQQNGMCAQRILRSVWASAQSDQSLRCPHDESFGP